MSLRLDTTLKLCEVRGESCSFADFSFMTKHMLLFTLYLRLLRECVILPIGKNLPITFAGRDLLTQNLVKFFSFVQMT